MNTTGKDWNKGKLLKSVALEIQIRSIKKDDLNSIKRIHAESIRLGTANAFLKERPVSFYMDWYNAHLDSDNPIMIAEADKKLLGWITLSPYRKGREAFQNVREVSYYIDKAYWNKGIATLLMTRIIELAREKEVKTLLAFIMDVNPASIRIMQKFEFQIWGRLPGIIEMPHDSFDHLIFGRKI